jgi:hypothetical protein
MLHVSATFWSSSGINIHYLNTRWTSTKNILWFVRSHKFYRSHYNVPVHIRHVLCMFLFCYWRHTIQYLKLLKIMYNLYSVWLLCYWLSWLISAWCNRWQWHPVVCQPMKPLTSRLPACQNLLVQGGDSY